jgi:hypothetical protein
MNQCNTASRTNEWINHLMDGLTDELTNGLVDGLVNELMDGWMNLNHLIDG